MATLYLHIGMHKTASTAIQEYFHMNRERLGAAGLAYLKGFESNHSRLMRTLFDPQFERRTFGAVRAADRERYFMSRDSNREMLESFFRECAEAGTNALISGEGMSVLPPDGVERLRQAAAPFDRVVVITFVRPPVAFLTSMAMQHLKSARRMSSILAKPPVPKYRDRFEPYLKTFGPENVIFQVFAREMFIDGCPLQTVLSFIDGDFSSFANDRLPTRNESLTLPAAKVAEAFLEANPGISAVWFNQNVVPWLARLKGVPFSLPAHAVESASDAMAEDVAWMEERLGTSLAQFDSRPADFAPSLEEWRTFSASEVGAMLSAVIESRGDGRRRRN